ncbi:MFS general substrate transporter [Aspergillus sclerotiicarbonarius CBS 121057]|uniref:MFS general substrate transporter n=1 Tax=Aspergillus sclerotiicarbonarius (strain CBS 121057 / IBT 28362) TaxID=1448318 RepID=A0A319E1X8_ASPSB|nr:MFS general substrate transporter [Aspergillus sclerotiicarbonarius CBS 121057]
MLSLITIIVSWDATALSVALATITSQLQGTTFQSFWASIAFTLGVAVTQPIYASVSDVLGRKLPLYVSMVLFAVGSVIFATACNINVVVVGWLIQGLGGGGLDVLETIILTDITTLKERPRYQGVMSVSIASGVIGGPLVGGVFAAYVNWRWLGWINLPFVGSAALLSILFLRLRSIDMDFKTKVRRLDWMGFLLFTIGATAVALPLSWAGSLYPWGSWRTLVPLTIGCLVLAVFAFLERKAIEPMIPYRIFDNRTAIVSTIFSSVFQKSIAAVGDLPESLSILKDSSRAIDFIPELRTLDVSADLMDSVIDAYQKTFQMIWLVLACIAAVASLISFLVKDLTLEKEEVGRQAFQSS